MLRAAEAYKAQREIRAQGEAAKFLSILEEYQKAREVTEQRLYVETLQRVLPKAQKIVISPQLEGQLLPLLPLREQAPLRRPAAASDGQRGQTEVMTMPQLSPQSGRSIR
jgi:membrane protease subunit HflK